MKLPIRFLPAGMTLLLLFLGCTSADVQQSVSNKHLFIRGVEAINARNWDALDELIAADYVRHCQATPDVTVTSLEEFKQFLIQDAATFPDSRIAIDYLVEEGNMLAFYCRYIGTQKGPMGPFPASGKQMTLEFSGVHRFENGKLAETRLTWDNLSALVQLGHFPPPSPEEK